MTGHGGWAGRGGGYRPSQVVGRYLRAAGFVINNDRLREGMKVTTFGHDHVRILLDYDMPHDDLPDRLLAVLDVLREKGFTVRHLQADRAGAWAVVYRAPLKRAPKKVTRSGDG